MKKKWKIFTECIVACLIFCLLIGVIQKTLRPVYFGGSTTMVEGLSELDDPNVDVLFLGASQLFATINAQTLTEQYGIDSYNLGASSQPLTITKFYLQEALNVVTPKIVAIELCGFYWTNESVIEEVYYWNYAAQPLTINKLQNIKEFSGSNYDVLRYGLFPLLAYHSRWSSLQLDELLYNWGLQSYDYSLRGFVSHDHAESVEIAYLSGEEGKMKEIPNETVNAINEMVEMCEQRGIKVLFFKTPVSNWTRADSNGVKEFMRDKQYTFLEMNDYHDSIQIDPKTDFYDAAHLNTSGAKKATAFMAGFLNENYSMLFSERKEDNQ